MAPSQPNILLPPVKKLFVQLESVWVDRQSGFYAREDEPALTCTTTPVLEIQKLEMSAVLEDSLKTLSPREKDVFIRHFQGESYDQIGHAYGFTRQRAYKLAKTARQKLQNILKKEEP